MTQPVSVLVVGAAASGLATVEALRRKGYAGAITVLGEEPHAPYDRPPLSKQVLAGAWEPSRAALRAPEVLAGLDAEFVYGDAATALDPATRTVQTESGRELSADAIVIATGMRARALPGQQDFVGVHLLRTLDDALALRDALLACTRLVVVGEGVLGAEIAATARTMGLEGRGGMLVEVLSRIQWDQVPEMCWVYMKIEMAFGAMKSERRLAWTFRDI